MRRSKNLREKYVLYHTALKLVGWYLASWLFRVRMEKQNLGIEIGHQKLNVGFFFGI
jgi:hypothetical protein